MKEAKKITLVANSIPSKCLKFGSRCLESNLSHLFKCTYAQLRSVLGLLQNISWCAEGGQQHDFPFNVYKCVANNYSKEQALSMDQNRKVMNTIFLITLKICQ